MDILFAERYGYVKPSEALLLDCMPKVVVNALCNCLQRLEETDEEQYDSIRRFCWTDFFNEKQSKYDRYNDCLISCLDDEKVEWFHKLELLDFFIDILDIVSHGEATNQFVEDVNYQFERLRYGYRIINNLVTPITAKNEIECVEEAINNSTDNINAHLNCAMKHLSDKESPDYRNSIKESISAVGVLCREMTGENDLGKSLYVLEQKQGKLHPLLKNAFGTLYNYTSDKRSGIRHELMDENGPYIPSFHEAKFMLITCSAFINYIKGKYANCIQN